MGTYACGVARLLGLTLFLLSGATATASSPLRPTGAPPAAFPVDSSTRAACAMPRAKRIPCGIYETRRNNMHGAYDFGAACRSRGCCYEPLTSNVDSAQPNCWWAGEGVEAAKAHLIQSNHFDAGFTDQLDAVVNSYFDTFFPGAVRPLSCLFILVYHTEEKKCQQWLPYTPTQKPAAPSAAPPSCHNVVATSAQMSNQPVHTRPK